MEQRERIAKAICRIRTESEEGWAEYLSDADAAIAAIPSPRVERFKEAMALPLAAALIGSMFGEIGGWVGFAMGCVACFAFRNSPLWTATSPA